MTNLRKFLVRIIFSVLFVITNASITEAYQTKNIFIVVIDGVRSSEFFDDPLHQYIPHIWNDLRPKGSIYRNFYNISHTTTTPGHATITSGVEHYIPLNYRNGVEYNIIQEEPSIFEYYRKQKGIPKEKVWIVNGKGAQMGRTGESSNPLYGLDYSPSISYYPVGAPSVDVWNELQTIMDTYHPSLVLVNFRDPDHEAHNGIWDNYVNAIKTVDAYVYELYNKISTDPFYKDNTTLIITSDHGRHLDGIYNGFQGHGDSCMGCRKIPFLALGPDIKQNMIIDTPATLADIAPTVGELLGFELPLSEGNIMWDMIKNGAITDLNDFIKPSVAINGNLLHTVWMGRNKKHWRIYYQRSQDGGKSWELPVMLSISGMVAHDPVVVTSGTKVVAAWSIYEGGLWYIVYRESYDDGLTWSEEKIIYQTFDPIGANLSPQLNLDGNYIELMWNNFLNMITYNKILSGQIVEDSIIDGLHMKSPSFSTHNSTTHAVFYQLNYDARNWEIYYTYKNNLSWANPIQLSNAPGSSVDPSITVDDYAIHVVWSDNRNGVFEIFYKRSFDGIVWSKTKKIVSNALGALHPKIVSSSEGLIVVWEDYRDGIAQIYMKKSMDGGTSWSSDLPVKQNNYHCINPSVATDTFGNVYVVWQQYEKAKSNWIINGEKISTGNQQLAYLNSSLWTGVVDLYVSNNYAYCAFWNGLGIMDLTDPTQPILLSRTYLGGTARAVTVNGSIAYIADDWKGLQIIDVSDPIAPATISTFSLDHAMDVYLQPPYAFIADGLSGLQILNVSDPMNPVLVGGHPTTGFANGIAVKGNYAYVAARSGGLEIFDISDPVNPYLIGHYKSLNAFKVDILNGYAYIADGQNGLEIVDVSNPALPVGVGHYAPMSIFWDVYITDSLAYMVDQRYGIFIVNIADPTNPILVGSYTSEYSNWAYSVFVDQSYAYIADGWTDAMSIIDISIPENPVLIGNYSAPSEIYAIDINKKFTFTGAENGVWIEEISDPVNPVPVSFLTTPGHVMDLRAVGNYLFVADGRGLDVVDVTDTGNPLLIASYQSPGTSYALDVKDNLVYLADLTGGLQIIDVSTPSNPIQIGSYSNNYKIRGVRVKGNYAYIASSGGGLEIVDISDPTNPILTGRFDTSSSALDISLYTSYALVAVANGGLQIVDVSNVAAPTLISSYDTPGKAFKIHVMNDYAFVSDIDNLGHKEGTLLVFDISDPTKPVLVDSYDTPGMPFNISNIYSILYIADFASIMIMKF